MEKEEKPSPSPWTCQTFGGPAAGQDFSSPVSGEMPSRCGPRHCGQSPAIHRVAVAEARMQIPSIKMQRFIATSLLCCQYIPSLSESHADAEAAAFLHC